VFSKFNMWVYRKSNGRVGATWLGKEAPICLFTTTGRRSGMARTVPLIFMADGNRLVVVASQGGVSTDPEWYLNVVASPRVTVDVEGDAQAMVARTASPEEKAELWPRLVAMYPKYDTYQQRTTREIPVVICTPGS
jgi:deazaflavin-dependent oxidoreductase (nitroreductase family)